MLVQFATFLKRVPLLFLGSLLGTRRLAIGHFLPFPSNSPEVFAKANSAQFPSRCLSGDMKNREFQQRRFRATHVNRK